MFCAGGSLENMPSTLLTDGDLTDGTINILDLMVKCRLAPSKGEARRLIQQGGVEANGVKVDNFTTSFSTEDLSGQGVTIKKGKKIFHRVSI